MRSLLLLQVGFVLCLSLNVYAVGPQWCGDFVDAQPLGAKFDMAISPQNDLPCIAYLTDSYDVYFQSQMAEGTWSDPELVFSWATYEERDEGIVLPLLSLNLAVSGNGDVSVIFGHTATLEPFHVAKLMLATRRGGVWTRQQISQDGCRCDGIHWTEYHPYRYDVGYSTDNTLWVIYGRHHIDGGYNNIPRTDTLRYTISRGYDLIEEHYWESEDDNNPYSVSLCMNRQLEPEVQPRVTFKMLGSVYFAEKGSGQWNATELLSGHSAKVGVNYLNGKDFVTLIDYAPEPGASVLYIEMESGTWISEVVYSHAELKEFSVDSGSSGPFVAVTFGDDPQATRCKYREAPGVWKNLEPDVRDNQLGDADSCTAVNTIGLPYILCRDKVNGKSGLFVASPPRARVVVSDKDSGARLDYPAANVFISMNDAVYEETQRFSYNGNHYITTVPNQEEPYTLYVVAKGYRLFTQDVYLRNLGERIDIAVELEKTGCGLSTNSSDSNTNAAVSLFPLLLTCLISVVFPALRNGWIQSRRKRTRINAQHR